MSEGTRRKRLHRSGVIAYLLERQSDMCFPFALPFELRLNLIVPISLHGEPVRCYVAEKSSAWSEPCAALAVFPNRVYLAARLQPGPFVWQPHRGGSITSAPASHKAFLRWRTPQCPSRTWRRPRHTISTCLIRWHRALSTSESVNWSYTWTSFILAGRETFQWCSGSTLVCEAHLLIETSVDYLIDAVCH